MPYEEGVYEAVAAAYAQKRRGNRAKFERRQLEIHEKIPKILEIDRELSQTAFSVARAVLTKTGDAAQLVRGLAAAQSAAVAGACKAPGRIRLS